MKPILNIERVENTTQPIWRDVVGYEGLYKVSNNGVIMSLPKPYNGPRGVLRYTKSCILKPRLNSTGYFIVQLYNERHQAKFMFVHRIIAFAFIPNPNRFPCINHINSNRQHNSLSNLEWCTNSQNQLHAFAVGFQRKGEDKINSKLTEQDVLQIKTMLIKRCRSYADIGKQFNVSAQTIFYIEKGLVWKHVNL